MSECSQLPKQIHIHDEAMPEVTLETSSGEMHVFLDEHSDDHIVTKYVVTPRGEYVTTLPHGEWAWERAVDRAKRAVAFCED